jgi:hypothetical protein
VIQEALRVNSPAAMSKERLSPPENLESLASDGNNYLVPTGVSRSVLDLVLLSIHECTC